MIAFEGEAIIGRDLLNQVAMQSTVRDLDSPEEIDGAGLETLLLQELRAHNEYGQLGYSLHYWGTSNLEVDFVLYGARGLKAFEVKRASRVRDEDLAGLRSLLEDCPPAEARLLYGGTRRYHEGAIEVVPFADGLRELSSWLRRSFGLRKKTSAGRKIRHQRM